MGSLVNINRPLLQERNPLTSPSTPHRTKPGHSGHDDIGTRTSHQNKSPARYLASSNAGEGVFLHLLEHHPATKETTSPGLDSRDCGRSRQTSQSRQDHTQEWPNELQENNFLSVKLQLAP